MFRDAVKAVTRHGDEDEPEPHRKSGETDKGFIMVVKRRYDRRRGLSGRYAALKAAKQTGAAARGRFAKLRPAKGEPKAAPKVVAPADTYARACLSLSDTLDWFNLWEANANNYQWQDADFSAKQDQYFPQP
jgi:hypothetical protein